MVQTLKSGPTTVESITCYLLNCQFLLVLQPDPSDWLLEILESYASRYYLLVKGSKWRNMEVAQIRRQRVLMMTETSSRREQPERTRQRQSDTSLHDGCLRENAHVKPEMTVARPSQ